VVPPLCINDHFRPATADHLVDWGFDFNLATDEQKEKHVLSTLEDALFGMFVRLDNSFPGRMQCGDMHPEAVECIGNGLPCKDVTLLNLFAGAGRLVKRFSEFNHVQVEQYDCSPEQWDPDATHNRVIKANSLHVVWEYGKPKSDTYVCVIFEFPPPKSAIPAEVLKTMLERNAKSLLEGKGLIFSALCIVQEELTGTHCGNEDYETILKVVKEYIDERCKIGTRMKPHTPGGFESNTWMLDLFEVHKIMAQAQKTGKLPDYLKKINFC